MDQHEILAVLGPAAREGAKPVPGVRPSALGNSGGDGLGEPYDREVEMRAGLGRRAGLVEQAQCFGHELQGFRHLFDAAVVAALALHVISLVTAWTGMTHRRYCGGRILQFVRAGRSLTCAWPASP